jgi:hypothetical protein
MFSYSLQVNIYVLAVAKHSHVLAEYLHIVAERFHVLHLAPWIRPPHIECSAPPEGAHQHCKI